MFILGEITNSIWPSLWSAGAATCSAIAAIVSGFISYKSFSHQKTKDEINLKPNLFLKGEETEIYNDIRFYLKNNLKEIDLIETYPFKFIKVRNISNEPIVDITIKCQYESHYKYEEIKELEEQIKNTTIIYGDVKNYKKLHFDAPNTYNEETKIPILEKNDKGLVTLPNALLIDLWKDFVTKDYKKTKEKDYKMKLDISYSHSYSEKPVNFNREIVFTKIVSDKLSYDSKNVFKYETYVFPKK